MHATLTKFGFPETAVATFEHWIVALRLPQVTLGSLVLIAKCDATSFAALPTGAYAELEIVTKRIEPALRAFRNFDKINYVMLMMTDPHVHFHVFPRFKETQTFEGMGFPDSGWPGAPDLKGGTVLPPATTSKLVNQLAALFKVAG